MISVGNENLGHQTGSDGIKQEAKVRNQELMSSIPEWCHQTESDAIQLEVRAPSTPEVRSSIRKWNHQVSQYKTLQCCAIN